MWWDFVVIFEAAMRFHTENITKLVNSRVIWAYIEKDSVISETSAIQKLYNNFIVSIIYFHSLIIPNINIL